jgi:hypothetical protein
MKFFIALAFKLLVGFVIGAYFFPDAPIKTLQEYEKYIMLAVIVLGVGVGSYFLYTRKGFHDYGFQMQNLALLFTVFAGLILGVIVMSII